MLAHHGLKKATTHHLTQIDRVRASIPTVCKDGTCSADVCTAISDLGKSKRFQAGETVFWQGVEAESYFLITSGLMRAVRFLDDGRRQITRFIFPGTLIVHKDNVDHIYSGEAITDIEVRIIPRDVLDNLVSAQPCLADLVTCSILEELRETQDHLLTLGKLKAEERVSHFLSVLKRRLPGMEKNEINIPMSRTDIADYLGLTIETVSRVLGRMKRQGKISLPTCNRITVAESYVLDRHQESFAA